jgi:transcriptional regulator with XRE-family HTH domain
MAFVIRKFDYTESLGEKLKAIRQCANKTLSEMAQATKIRKSILKSFENGDYASLPDPVYARNFLKIYVRTLGGDADYFLQQFESECGTSDFAKNNNLPRERARSFQFLVPSRFIKMFAIALVALAMVTYLGSQIRSIISPPDLFVYEPSDGILTQEALITVTGQAQEGAQVKVNGTAVLLSENGTFETDIALERGLNVISVESTKRYSQPAIEYRRVVLQQDHIFSLAP